MAPTVVPPLPPPVLSYPLPGALAVPLAFSLQWLSPVPPHLPQPPYHVQLKPVSAAEWLIDETGLTPTAWPVSDLTPGTLYQWRVCAFNSAGLCSTWAEGTFTTLAVDEPALSIIPTPPQPLAFGAVAVGTSLPDTLTLASIGAAPVSVRLPELPPGSVFAYAPEVVEDTVLAPGASYPVPVVFTPSEALFYSHDLVIDPTASGLAPVTVTMTGTGLEGPVLSLTPGALNFGPVVVGDVESRTVSVRNTGTGTLSGTYALPAGGPFRFEDGTWGPVTFSVEAAVAPQPPPVLEVVVFFETLDPGNYAGVLTFSDNSSAVLGEVSLLGVGTLPASSTGRFYYVRDHLGSVRATLNEAGSVVHYDDYYPFGAPMPLRSHVEGDEGAPEGKPRYTGHEREEDIDPDGKAVYYAGARYYDALIGRWSATDPLDEFHSPYVYVGNNPLAFVDPTGMFSTAFAWHFDHEGNLVSDPGDDFGKLVDFFGSVTAARRAWNAMMQQNCSEESCDVYAEDGSVKAGTTTDLSGVPLGEGIQSVYWDQMSNFLPGPKGIKWGNKWLAKIAVSFGRRGGSRLVKIVERADDLFHLTVKTSKGEVEVLTFVAKEGDTIVLRDFNVDGLVAGALGPRAVREYARTIGRELSEALGMKGVSKVRIEGGVRVTGANPGRIPRAIEFSLE